MYDPWFSRASASVLSACHHVLDRYRARGWIVVPISIPFLTQGQSAHALTILNDISSLLPSLYPSFRPPSLSLLTLMPSDGRLGRLIMQLPLTQRRHACVIVLHAKGDALGQAGVAFAPLVDGLEHAARVLDVPEDAAVGGALVGRQALEPVGMPLPPIRVRDGVVLVPPAF